MGAPASRGKSGGRPALPRNGSSPNARSESDHVPCRPPGRRGKPCASQGHVVRGVRVDWRHWPDRSGQFAPAAGGSPVLHRLSQRAL